MSAPTITPVKLKEFNCKQSSYNEVVPKLPMRSMLCGPKFKRQSCIIIYYAIGYS